MAKKEFEDKKKMLREETIQGILAVFFFALGLVLVFSVFGKAGVAGRYLYHTLRSAFGVGFFVLPVLSFALTVAFLRALRGFFPLKKTIASFALFFSALGIVGIIAPSQGGAVGEAVQAPLIAFFDQYSALVILTALFVIIMLVVSDASIPMQKIAEAWSAFRERRRALRIRDFSDTPSPAASATSGETAVPTETEPAEEPAADARREKKPKEKSAPAAGVFPVLPRLQTERYAPPPISLLEADHGKPGVGDIKANANIIKRTLQNFGIEVEMDEVSIGPAVTRYSLKPAENVRLSKIVALQRELELSLAAHPIRIEAPIPGKSLVGVEIPNNIKATVGLATVLSNPEFTASDKPLFVSLGKDLSGKTHFANLAKMPHILIAGATGSGKSVTIHTLITSLLFRNGPADLKLMLIDPKRVELTLYNNIPHLLTPVITDPKKAILCLRWAAKEMDRRYDILESESVRDIESYHKNIVAPEYKKSGGADAAGEEDDAGRLPERMPYIIIVIDELADLMSMYPRELESAVVRLAQMSRAVGIHLVLSTQRPSVNIITGLIKANIPGRIALQVSSQVDSRTILDAGGAEKLLGAGDMLFLSGEMAKPIRLQSACITEHEVKKVTAFLRKTSAGEPPADLNLGNDSPAFASFESDFENGEEVDDDLYEAARGAVLQAGKASTSYLQRKLRIGYARAARIMDMLEERNIIGPADGSKPRSVIGAEPDASARMEEPSGMSKTGE